MQRIGFATLAAGLLILAGSTSVRAQNDTVRLGTSASGAATGGDDTELVHWGRGYGWGGGWGRGYGWGGGWGRGYGWGGGWGGYGWGGWGGYGWGGWGGYGWGGYGWYRPYFATAFYRPFVYVNYYQPYYYAAPAYYYSISGQADVPVTYAQAPAQAQTPTSQYPGTTSRPQLLPPPMPVPQRQQPAGPQTFPYDGGPQTPVPMPQADPASGPRLTVPLQGKVVSLPRETTLGTTQHLLVSLSNAQPPTRPSPGAYTYRAYGEQPLPAVRKRTN